MLLCNRGWLKYEFWDIFDKDVTLDMLNISDITNYSVVVYQFDKNGKILKF